MKKRINENRILNSLVSTSNIFAPTEQFRKQLLSELTSKSTHKKNLFNKIKLFMIRRKKIVLGITAVITPLFLFSVVMPTQAKEIVNAVKKCGVSIECYEKKSYEQNTYGDQIEITDGVDEQGRFQGKTVAVSLESNKKILEKLNAKVISENNKKIHYKLPSGTEVDLVKDKNAHVDWDKTFYHFEWAFYMNEVFGKDSLSDSNYLNYLNAYKKIEGKDPLKLSIEEEKAEFAKNLFTAKMYDDFDYKPGVYKYSFNGKKFKYIFKETGDICRPQYEVFLEEEKFSTLIHDNTCVEVK